MMLTSCKKESLGYLPDVVVKPSIEFTKPVDSASFLPGDTMHLVWSSKNFGDKKISIMAGHKITWPGVVAWDIGNDMPNNGVIDVVIPGDTAMVGEWEAYTLADTFPMAYKRFFIDNSVGAFIHSSTPAPGGLVHMGVETDLFYFGLYGKTRIDMLRFRRTGISSNTSILGLYLYDVNTNEKLATASLVGNDFIFDGLKLNIQNSRVLKVRVKLATGISGYNIALELKGLRIVATNEILPQNFSSNFLYVVP